MTARRDGCFGWLIADLNLDILFTDKNDPKEVEKIKDRKAAIAVLRAAEDAEMICANKLARAILNARRVHERGNPCAKS
jgi:hypothetical protein